jgi:hypothetical protein
MELLLNLYHNISVIFGGTKIEHSIGSITYSGGGTQKISVESR